MFAYVLMVCSRRILMVVSLLGMVWLPQFTREFVLSLIVMLLAEATSQTLRKSAEREEKKGGHPLVEPTSETIYSTEDKR